MTLIELQKIAKEGDRGERKAWIQGEYITLPIEWGIILRDSRGLMLTTSDILADDWQLIPRAKECFVNVYEKENIYCGWEHRNVKFAKDARYGIEGKHLGTLHITYDGKLKVEVVE